MEEKREFVTKTHSCHTVHPQTISNTRRPRLLVTGATGMGQRQIAMAVIHALEGFATFTLDLPSEADVFNRVARDHF